MGVLYIDFPFLQERIGLTHMNKKVLSVIFCLFFGFAASAQQDVQFSQYMLNPLFYNAGWAGVDGSSHVSAMHRSQWAGYSSTFDGDGGAPTSQLISFSTPLKIKEHNLGVGVNFINDIKGPISDLNIDFVMAYHKNIRKGKLSFGIKPSIISHTIHGSRFRPNDENDPFIPSSKVSNTMFDLGIGGYYTTEDFSLGLGINHLLRPTYDFGEVKDDFRNRFETNLNISGQYNYDVAYKLVFKPSILIKSDFSTYSFDLSGVFEYDEKIWGGLSYRDNEAIILLMGYSFLDGNKMRVGYGFDYVVGEQEAKQPTSHEIFVRYNLPNISAGSKKIIRTPRFRF